MKPYPYPAETIEALSTSPIYAAVDAFTKAAAQAQRNALESTGATKLPVGETIPTMVCAMVSFAAWCAMSSAGSIPAMFDPVEFGKACERIAVDVQRQHIQTFEAPGARKQ